MLHNIFSRKCPIHDTKVNMSSEQHDVEQKEQEGSRSRSPATPSPPPPPLPPSSMPVWERRSRVSLGLRSRRLEYRSSRIRSSRISRIRKGSR